VIDTPKRVKGKMVQVFLNRMLGMEIHDQALLCASIALPGHTEPVSCVHACRTNLNAVAATCVPSSLRDCSAAPAINTRTLMCKHVIS